MSNFFGDTMASLQQEVAIWPGNLPVTKAEGIPYEKYRVDAADKHMCSALTQILDQTRRQAREELICGMYGEPPHLNYGSGGESRPCIGSRRHF